jgi:hypothetical protein
MVVRKQWWGNDIEKEIFIIMAQHICICKEFALLMFVCEMGKISTNTRLGT